MNVRKMYEAMSNDELEKLFDEQYKKVMKEVHPDPGMAGMTPDEIEKRTRLAQKLNQLREEVKRLKRS